MTKERLQREASTREEPLVCVRRTLPVHFMLACRWAAERRRGLAAPIDSNPKAAFTSFYPAAQWPRPPRQRSEQVTA